MKVVLITGISGSGKSIAIKVLEDDGYYCIDNLPAPFLQQVIQNQRELSGDRVAVSVDARSGASVTELAREVERLNEGGHDVRVLFLNASTETLVQRYSETRRRHPMSMSTGGASLTIEEAIELERDVMAPLQSLGVNIDTTDLHPNVLRAWVRDVVGSERAPLTVLFESFAYKHGVPLNADLVFDVRCLPNPYYNATLRPMSGLDAPVKAYLGGIPAVTRMIEDIARFLHTWLPSYVQENRSYLSVAIGCTGGQHRSVYCVEELAKRFRSSDHVIIRHRAMAARQQIAHG